MIKPSGWQISKYDFVEGKYLYNRCHLIGYQLTGENANLSNLITGTRYMNTQGMLPFENKTAEYIRSTGNHVMYRVTPVFEGNNLVATGVLMEGLSVEDTIAEEQNTKIRCAAYCRVSSDSEDQLNSFMAQTRYYEKAFENSETEQLVDIYADEGITGTREDKRDEFQRMIKDCRRGKIDRIYTKSISRFARNTKDCLKNMRELKSLGITVFFEKENIDTAKLTDEMMITIMGGLAQEESTSISQNMRWSVQKRMQNGTYKNATPPFGFKKVNGDLEIEENQAPIVRQIFEWYISGYGLKTIADMLNGMNLPGSKQGVLWKADNIRYMLKNDRYIGNAMFQKSYVSGIKRVDKKGRDVLCEGFMIQVFEDEAERVELDNFSAAVGFEILENCLAEAEQFAKDYVDCEEKNARG